MPKNNGMKLPELPKPPELSKLGGAPGEGSEAFIQDLLPMFPTEGPPLPRVFDLKWPWAVK
jgi:hypothetical protein